MLLHSDTVLDEYSRGVPGASIYVYGIDGTYATLTSDGTASLSQPITTDEFGSYSYYADVGYYTEEVWYGGKRRSRTHNIAIGNPSSDLALRSDLEGDAGFTLVKHKIAAAGAYARSAAEMARLQALDHPGNVFHFIHPDLDDSVLNHSNTTDLAPSFQAASDNIGSAGGTILVPNTGQFLIDSNMTIKPNVTLKGAFGQAGSPKDNTSYPYHLVGGLIVNNAATITLKGGAGIEGVLIQRKGITYPATVGSFAGTAITAGGDDYFVTNSMILGFAQAIYSTLCQRPRITDVNIDCTAGVWIDQALDIPRLRGVHCWPFTNVASGGASLAHRSGAAFKFTNCDWPHLNDCFSYGYFRGIENDGSDDLVAINHAIDGTQVYAGSRGISIINDALRNNFIGLKCSSQDTGLYLNASASAINNAELIGGSIVTSTTQAVLVDGGDLATLGTSLMGAPYGIKGTSSASRITVDDTRFASIATRPIDVAAGTTLLLGTNDFGDFATNPVNGATIPIIASAATLVLPNTGSVFQVSGTTAVTAISYGWAGREVTLTATGAFTLTNGASLMLAGATNFAMTADDQIRLGHDGTKWREISRSVN